MLAWFHLPQAPLGIYRHPYHHHSLLKSCSLSRGVTILSDLTSLALFTTRTAHYFFYSKFHSDVFTSTTRTDCISTCMSSQFSLFPKSFRSSMKRGWIIVGSPFHRLYPALTFLNTSVSRISVNINSNGERLSPWNIPLFIHTSHWNTWLPAVSSVHCFRLFWATLVRFSAIPNMFLRHSIIKNANDSSWIICNKLYKI